MRRIILFAAAGIAAAALPGGTALADDGAAQPQATGGEQAPPSFGTTFVNSMCASPAQVSFPGAQNNCNGTPAYY
ncbi:MAG TPA: hypothetical protein VGH89_41925 [Pseudonocardia sp.]|jgi:hypothetical protein